MNIWQIKKNLLTLFTLMELLSSMGSTAAALTLNRTPMRVANTTRSCMLWQESGVRRQLQPQEQEVDGDRSVWGREGGWVSGWVAALEEERVEESEQLRDPRGGWWRKGQLVSKFGIHWCFFRSLPPKSLTLLYASTTACHWRTGWWVYDGGGEGGGGRSRGAGGGGCLWGCKRRGDEVFRTE